MAKNTQNWMVRKGAYFVIGAVLAVAAVFGWITVDQADEWLAIAERVITTIGSAFLIYAGTKTHRGSDDDTTKDDVVAAASSGPAELVKQLQHSVEEIRERLTSTPIDTTTPSTSAQGGIYPAGQ